jgi:beta-phosphoglucomutase-like phosphatase (HAD superfamily)
LGIEPAAGAAVEDSTNGLLSAKAAGLAVIAIPNRDFPPGPQALAAADVVLHSLHELTPETIEKVTA